LRGQLTTKRWKKVSHEDLDGKREGVLGKVPGRGAWERLTVFQAKRDSLPLEGEMAEDVGKEKKRGVLFEGKLRKVNK